MDELLSDAEWSESVAVWLCFRLCS